jgi:hypothetical protein
MSEYQYYEFLAVDQPLSDEQMRELRGISSRAKITPTSLTNTYSYGDFRGDPVELLTSHFDAHVHVANWGSYTFMLGFPRAAVDIDLLKQYAVEALSSYVGGLAVQERGDRVLVDFSFNEEEGRGGGWMDEGEAESWMPSMIQLRTDIMNGDLRAMYLAWLAGATVNLLEYADMDEDELDEVEADALESVEPPIPDGLGKLSAPLRKLTEFLALDTGLVSAAAERSEKLEVSPSDDDAMMAWITSLIPAEKHALLMRVARGETTVGAELRRRFRAASQPASSATASAGPRRTVRELVLAGRDRAEELKRKRDESAKRKREKELDELAGREEAVWRDVETLIEKRQGRPYDDAVALLKDLAELADFKERRSEFSDRLAALRERHRNKATFIDRLNAAHLE